MASQTSDSEYLDYQSPINGTKTWRPEPQTRGTFGLVWPCLVTLTLCVWSSVHLNVPGPDRHWKGRVGVKIIWLFMAVLAPEVVLLMAYKQHVAANELTKAITKDENSVMLWYHGLVHRPAHILKLLWRSLTGCVSLRSSKKKMMDSGQAEAWKDLESYYNEHETTWTRAHSFLVNMGGLALSTCDESGNSFVPDVAWIRVTPEGARYIYERDPEVLKAIRKEHVQDKGKASGLVKAIVIIQTIFFLTRCIVRLSKQMGLAPIEVNTAMHVISAVLMNMLWWDKPYDVQTPIIIKDKNSARLAALLYTIHKKKREELALRATGTYLKDKLLRSDTIETLDLPQDLLSEDESDSDVKAQLRTLENSETRSLAGPAAARRRSRMIRERYQWDIDFDTFPSPSVENSAALPSPPITAVRRTFSMPTSTEIEKVPSYFTYSGTQRRDSTLSGQLDLRVVSESISEASDTAAPSPEPEIQAVKPGQEIGAETHTAAFEAIQHFEERKGILKSYSTLKEPCKVEQQELASLRVIREKNARKRRDAQKLRIQYAKEALAIYNIPDLQSVGSEKPELAKLNLKPWEFVDAEEVKDLHIHRFLTTNYIENRAQFYNLSLFLLTGIYGFAHIATVAFQDVVGFRDEVEYVLWYIATAIICFSTPAFFLFDRILPRVSRPLIFLLTNARKSARRVRRFIWRRIRSSLLGVVITALRQSVFYMFRNRRETIELVQMWRKRLEDTEELEILAGAGYVSILILCFGACRLYLFVECIITISNLPDVLFYKPVVMGFL
ncbi:hypothetical protein BJ508DRAFT_69269 [Ascobolus immersus RN42]|uniref:Uncharacterized protein n=1 Tax=Ascobolus immersus RN42 TaxID=1160509 RepID=A0A3N4HSK1_ASCIM|nr:hypothetical protein BJ508DRAFT_69269 [Ascobolus immersus RN42]